MSHRLPVALVGALASEVRDLCLMIEELAGALASDDYLALNYLEQFQTFDLLAQRTTETANLLERLAHGADAEESLAQVRLERMQHRLRDMLKAA
jgi:hypothetical protein